MDEGQTGGHFVTNQLGSVGIRFCEIIPCHQNLVSSEELKRGKQHVKKISKT